MSPIIKKDYEPHTRQPSSTLGEETIATVTDRHNYLAFVEKQPTANPNDEAIHELIIAIPEPERLEAVESAVELYDNTSKYVAPIIVGFADMLLRKAEGRQIIFAARDGLGTFEAAKLLVEKFPDEYPGIRAEDLIFAYLTRRLVRNSNQHEITSYLHNLGVVDLSRPVVFSDIGMYGTVVDDISTTLPNIDPIFFISRNPNIPGYIDDGNRQERNTGMSSLRSICGNSAVHFLEDTFSGTTSSPDALVEVDGKQVPNYTQNAFPPDELLKRMYAISAIRDYTSALTIPPNQTVIANYVAELDHFLSDKTNYTRIMVPHIR